MREVMKWSKDYRTGEVITEKAYKPDNLRGKATIQLKDSNGNLVQEVETHNIIMPPMSKLPNPYYELMYQSLMTNTNLTSGSVVGGSNSPYSFDQMFLCTSDRIEDENNIFCEGEVVGWCPRVSQDAGTDVTRGIYNPTESYVKYEDGYYHAHLVYDFGTSQGNGTFNSIWWKPYTYKEYTSGSDRFIPMSIAAYALKYRPYSVGVYGSNFRRNILGEVCKLDPNNSNSLIPIENYKAAINGLERIKYKDGPIDYISSHSKKWSYDDKYYTGYGSQNFGSFYSNGFKDATITFTRVNALTGEDEATKVIKIWDEITDVKDRILSIGSTYSWSINIEGKFTTPDGVCWFNLKLVGPYNNAFPSIDSSGNISYDNPSSTCYLLCGFNYKSMTWEVKPGFNYDSMYINRSSYFYSMSVTDVMCIDPDSTMLVLCGDGYMRTVNFNTYKVRRYDMSYCGLAGLYGGSASLYCFDKFNNIIGNSNEWGYMLAPSYSAHTKLPNAVTKTSADTMKIQYDYYIQIPYVFTDDDNYIPDSNIPQD